MRGMQLIWAVPFFAAVVAATAQPVRAADIPSDEMEDYRTRHLAVWFMGEDEFIRIEDSFRDSTEPLVGRYGFENDFLADRMEDVYSTVSDTLGLDPVEFRVQVELVHTGNTGEKQPSPGTGEWFGEFGADYDPRSETVYIDSVRMGPGALASGLAIALLYSSSDFTPPDSLVRSALTSVRDAFPNIK